MRKQLHNSFRVSVSTEGHIVHLHFHVYNFVIDGNFLFSRQNSVSDSSRHAVPWNNDRILFISSPFLKCLQAKSSMKHTRSSKEHHRLISFKRTLVVTSNMRKVKHVFLNKGLLNLFVSPVNEQLIVKISFLCQSSREIDWVLQASTSPVSFK